MENPVSHIKTISELHNIFGLSKPKHPLVSVVRHSDMRIDSVFSNQRFSLDMYIISLKGNQEATLKYGRNTYDFQEGSMVFIAPNQVIASSSSDFSKTQDEWTIIVHSDFIQRVGLQDSMRKFRFFDYEERESLHLSDDEKKSLTEIIHKIEAEYHQRIDKHTDEIIAINLESLLKYCLRYYERQFITRKTQNKGLLIQFENYLNNYMQADLVEKGIPSVTQCGEALNLSPYYLSDLLKAETGKSAKEHIDLALINRAKNRLLQSNESVSEIAYGLGFDYPNHFSKLFKSKTGMSPKEYRTLN
jgi:AraC family transcriptional regulator, transcriptional activator of pobA